MLPSLRPLAVVVLTCASIIAGTGAVATTPDPLPDPSASSTSVRVVAAHPSDVVAEAERIVADMTMRERAASVVMGHIPSTDPAILASYMSADGLGGFILMGANVPPSESALREITAALVADPALPPLIAIDQEGGDVSRLPWDDFPAATTLKSATADDVQSAFAGRGALVRRVGASVNFGVVADVTADPGMFIYRRALGADTATSADHVAAAVRGEGDLVASTLKHFPGHGAAPGDSHEGVPRTDMPFAAWSESEAPPFRAGIEAGASLLMFGHLSYPSVDPAPASLSSDWHRIAREELGFEGVAITDDLGMLQASGIAGYADPVANAVAALAAGNDMVLTVVSSDAQTASRTVDGIVAAVDSGALSRERLTEAAVRVATLRLRSGESTLTPCADCSAVTR